MVIVKEGNEKIRLCIDPKPLNKAWNRNNIPTPFAMKKQVPKLTPEQIPKYGI